ncbi:MAG TPA: alpha/beta hydrolase [Acidimicrobiales bacterium]|nr:alpha/beta hydrolase [Acidimicrobiales bacterium]
MDPRGIGPTRRRRSWTRILGTVGALAVTVAACSSTPTPAPPRPGPHDAVPPAPGTGRDTGFAADGPYKPGVVFETTPEGDTVVVTYPVDASSTVGKPTYVINLLRWFTGSPSAPIPAGLPSTLPTTLATDAYTGVPISSRGPFPVVLFSHGYGGYPEQSSFLTDHLAAWGFVVVAPDHRSRDLKAVVSGQTGKGQSDVTDLRDALAFVRTMDTTAGTLLTGKLDLTRVASLGHSAGGGAAITVADDSDIRTYIGLAPANGTPPPSKPGLIMQGTSDKVVAPSGTRKLYERLRSPKSLVLIDGAGHNVFDDGCTIGAAQGGLVAFVKTLNLPPAFEAIATDGCSPPDISPPTAWPLIDQVVTAQLRFGLGIDTTAVGLGGGVDHAFPGVTASVKSDNGS